MADKTLNCKGLKCPLPIMEIAKAVKIMQKGQTLEVMSTDLAFPKDVEAWCRMTGNKLMSLAQSEGVATATIKLEGGKN